MARREIRLAALCATTALLLAGPANGAGAASASRSSPRLLAYDPGTTFVVRPPFMSFDETWHGHLSDFMGSPSLTTREFKAGKLGHVHWTRWGARAVGQASYWYGPTDSCGSTGSCRYIRFVVGLRAWRVRRDRYTRLQVLYRGSRYRPVFLLKAIRIPTNGVARGVPAFTWCDASDRARCLTP